MKFIILQSANEMCGICPKPGRCCKNFTLEDGRKRHRNYKSVATAQRRMDQQGLPFIAHWRKGEVRFDCPLLSAEGLCTVHGTERQPQMCKNYVPASNALCVFHDKVEYGQVEYRKSAEK